MMHRSFGLLDLLGWFALVGTAMFAISGALQGLRQEMDIVGVSFLAALAGVAGGTVRDVLLDAEPVGRVRNPTALFVCIACAIGVAFLNRRLAGKRLDWRVYADAVGMGLFAVLGTAKAKALRANPVLAIIFGAMSATFGGVIRDVVCQVRPLVFNKVIYVSAAVLGGIVYVGAGPLFSPGIAALSALLSAIALRLAAVHYHWHLPFPRYANHETKERDRGATG